MMTGPLPLGWAVKPEGDNRGPSRVFPRAFAVSFHIASLETVLAPLYLISSEAVTMAELGD